MQLLFCLLSLWGSEASKVSRSVNDVLAPTFFVGKSKFVSSLAGSFHRSQYSEVSMDTVAQIVATLASGKASAGLPDLFNKEEISSSGPTPTLVYIGHSMRSESAAHLGDAVAPLQEMLSDSESSVAAFPFVRSVASPALELIQGAVGVSAITLGCEDNGEQYSPAALSRLLASPAHVAIVCSSGADAATEAAEFARIASDAQTAMSTGNVLTVFVSNPAALARPQQLTSTARRSLLSAGGIAQNGARSALIPCTKYVNGTYNDAGAKCYTQVKIIEGVIVFLFLFFGCTAGLTLLSWLKAPTRFETAKEHKNE